MHALLPLYLPTRGHQPHMICFPWKKKNPILFVLSSYYIGRILCSTIADTVIAGDVLGFTFHNPRIIKLFALSQKVSRKCWKCVRLDQPHSRVGREMWFRCWELIHCLQTDQLATTLQALLSELTFTLLINCILRSSRFWLTLCDAHFSFLRWNKHNIAHCTP